MRRVAAGEYRRPAVIRYGEGGMTPNVALPCGGVLDVLIEYLPAGEDSIAYLQRIAGALEGHHALIKRLTLPNACHSLEQSHFTSATQVERRLEQITLHIAAAPRSPGCPAWRCTAPISPWRWGLRCWCARTARRCWITLPPS